MKFLALLCFCCVFLINLPLADAQSGYIVKYQGGEEALKNALKRDNRFFVADHIPYTDIYLLNAIDAGRSYTIAEMSGLGIPFTHISQDRKVEQRSVTPDDPYYKDQWQYDVMHAADAWAFGTGGVNCAGDTIVMAVMDGGFDLDHVDLMPNIWTNHAEIPGDGIDNDNNGYIDDIKGLNTGSDNDQHDLDSHGLKVAGVMGARGNNQKGVAGVNWTSKIMLVSYIASDFFVIKGLHYILTQRRKFNESNGKEGAFVVSVNNSFGIPNAFPEDGYDLWCNMYDSLGLAGIVSVGATTNSNKDVDVIGDIPSTCTSDYLIVVTNTDKNDKKVTNAGYGSKSVDIGAPGDGVFTVGLNNAYTTFTGTSASAPHVAGAIGLLYSTGCCELSVQAKADPAATALKVKDYILRGATPLISLKDITTKQARLDLAGAVTALTADCGNAAGKDKIDNFRLKNLGEKLFVKYTGAEYKNYTYSIYSVLGVELQTGNFEFKAYGSDEFEIDMKNLPTGAYIMSIKGGKEPVSSIFVKLK